MAGLSGPYTKMAALTVLSGHGYTELYDTGECGDGGYGSREYYSQPSPACNEFGVPLEHAEISRLGGRWYVSFFGGSRDD